MKGEKFEVECVTYRDVDSFYNQIICTVHDTNVYFWNDFVIIEDDQCHECGDYPCEPYLIMVPTSSIVNIVNPTPPEPKVIHGRPCSGNIEGQIERMKRKDRDPNLKYDARGFIIED